MNGSPFRLLVLFFFFSLVTSGVKALDLAEGMIELNTYGSIGLSRTLSDGVVYRPVESYQTGIGNDWTGRLDNRLGIQGTLRVSPDFAFTAQLLTRRNGADQVETAFPWAYLRWQPNGNWEARLGRFRQTTYLFSDSFDVGYAQLWARPPAELYALAGETNTLDGIQLRYRQPLGKYTFSATAHAGTLSLTRPNYEIEISRNIGMVLALSDENLTLQGSLIKADTTLQSPNLRQLKNLIAAQNPGVAEEYALGKIKNQYYGALGLRYENSGWQLISEVAMTRLRRKSIPDRVAWYLTVGKSFGEWTPCVTYAANRVLDSLSEDRLSGNAASAANALLSRGNTHQNTWSFGARWDVTGGIALKTQWDIVRPETYGFQAKVLPEGKDHFNVVSIILDWSF